MESEDPLGVPEIAVDVSTAGAGEMVGTLCVFSSSGDGELFEPEKIEMLADLAAAAARELEMIFSVRQRDRESAMRQSINELLCASVCVDLR